MLRYCGMHNAVLHVTTSKAYYVASSQQWRIQMGPGSHDPLEAHIQTLPLQKSVESKAGKRDFKNT